MRVILEKIIKIFWHMVEETRANIFRKRLNRVKDDEFFDLLQYVNNSYLRLTVAFTLDSLKDNSSLRVFIGKEMELFKKSYEALENEFLSRYGENSNE